MKLPHRQFGIFAISVLILSPIAFHSKSPLIFYRFDGTYLLIAAKLQKLWSTGIWNFSSDPMQGIGGLELPWHALLDPGLWLVASLPPSVGPVVAMTLYAMELGIAICWLGTRLGLNPYTAVAGAWIGLLVAFPYVYPPLGFQFLWGVPSYAPLIFEDLAIILFFFRLGKGPVLADVGRIVGIAAVATYHINQYPNFAPVTMVAVTFFGIVSVVAAESFRERAIKLGCAIVLAGLALAIFGQSIYGLYGFAKPTFFWQEFYPRPGSLHDLSFFVADFSLWPAWIVFGAALAGALHASFFGVQTIRSMARGFLAFVIAELALVFFVDEGWRGPRIAYIDIFAYPFYCVFCAYASGRAIEWFVARNIRFARYRRRGVIVLCVLPWLVLLDYWPPPLDRPLARNLNPFIWPPAETPVTKFLADEISLRPGAIFRGRVASIAGSDFEPQWVHAPFITQHNYDVMNLFFSGNDHHMYGLWYYDIPTLIELNQFESPFFHLVNARLLNAPGAQDLRSYETQSVANDRIMALLGARYLLSDKVLADRVPVLHYRLVEGRDLYLYSIARTNTAGYSATKTRTTADAAGVINMLADSSFDPVTTAILTGSDEVPGLVPVAASSLVVERGNYRVVADSPGTSLLVLPIEYSHCLQPDMQSTGDIRPRLLRTDLTLAGLLFSGHVEANLTLRYGPFSSECRFEDWREADALKIGDAREWPKTN